MVKAITCRITKNICKLDLARYLRKYKSCMGARRNFCRGWGKPKKSLISTKVGPTKEKKSLKCPHMEKKEKQNKKGPPIANIF